MKTITLHDIEFDCYFTELASEPETGYNGGLEELTIKIGDVDVTDILKDEIVETLTDKILNDEN